MCSVQSVTGTTVTMSPACYARATNGTNGPGVNIPTFIEVKNGTKAPDYLLLSDADIVYAPEVLSGLVARAVANKLVLTGTTDSWWWMRRMPQAYSVPEAAALYQAWKAAARPIRCRLSARTASRAAAAPPRSPPS